MNVCRGAGSAADGMVSCARRMTRGRDWILTRIACTSGSRAAGEAATAGASSALEAMRWVERRCWTHKSRLALTMKRRRW